MNKQDLGKCAGTYGGTISTKVELTEEQQKALMVSNPVYIPGVYNI